MKEIIQIITDKLKPLDSRARILDGSKIALASKSIKRDATVAGFDYVKGRATVNRVNGVEQMRVLDGTFVQLNGRTWLYQYQSIVANGNVKHARDLEVGDKLIGVDGVEIEVEKVRLVKRNGTFLKFDISGDHTYFSDGYLMHNASRYWIGNGGNYTDTAHWSASSGGSGGASAPTSVDNVFFDANSFNAGSQTVTLNVDSACADMTWTGATNSPAFDGSASSRNLDVYGSLTLIAAMTWTLSQINFYATSTGKTITSAGKNIVTGSTDYVWFAGVGGGWTLQDAFSAPTSVIDLEMGSLDTNGFAVTCERFYCDYTTARGLDLGASTVTVTSNASGGLGTWDFGTTTNLTFDAGTSSIVLTNTSATNFTHFNGGGLTYYNVTLECHGTSAASTGATTTGSTLLSGANTFNNLTINHTSAGKSNLISFQSGATQTVNGTFTANGNSAINRIHLRSGNYDTSISTSQITKTTGTAATISAATVSISNIDFMDITGAGAGSWTGTSIGDAGGNSGITMTGAVTRYWVGNAGTWSSTGEWAASSGGASGASVPLPQDTAIFDANSFSANGHTVTLDLPWIGTTNFTGIDQTMTWTRNTATLMVGALTLTANVTIGSFSAAFVICYRSSLTFNTAGRTTATWQYNVDSPGVTVTMGGAVTTSTTVGFQVMRGTLDWNGQNFTGAFLDSDFIGGYTRAITMGSGTFTLNGTSATQAVVDFENATGLTFTASTSQINITGAVTSNSGTQFRGGGKTFYNVTYTGARQLTIWDANTFNNLTMTGGAPSGDIEELRLQSSVTQTINGTFTVTGSSLTKRFFVNSLTYGGQSKINAAAISLTNVDFRGIDADGAAIDWTGTSLGDVGNNLNITFTAGANRYWIGGTGNWNDTAHWSTSSGGAGGASVPTVNDSIFFDANSFTAGSQVVTLNIYGVIANNMNWANASNSPTFAMGSNALYMKGNTVFRSAMTWTGTFEPTFIGGTLDTGGLAIPDNCAVTGDLQFLSDVMVGTGANDGQLWHYGGHLDLNDFDFTVGYWQGYFDDGNRGFGTRAVSMGSGTIELSGNNSVDWTFSYDLDGVTWDSGTSTLKFTSVLSTTDVWTDFFRGSEGSGLNGEYVGDDISFYNITLDAAGARTYWFAGGFQIAGTLTIGANKTVNFEDKGQSDEIIWHINNLVIQGTAGNLAGVNTFDNWNTNGVHYLDVTTAPTIEYVTVTTSDAREGNVIDASDGTSVNGGGNFWWLFVPPQVFSETVTIVDTLSKTAGKTLEEVVTVVDSFLRNTGKTLEDTITLVDTFSKNTGRLLNEGFTIVDSVRARISAKVLSEVVTIVDAVKRDVGRAFTEVVTVLDDILVEKAIFVFYSETITIVDTVSRSMSRALVEVVTIVDTVAKQTGRVFVEVVTVVDSILRMGGKRLNEVVTVVDTFQRNLSRVFVETFTIVDSLVRQIGRSFVEVVTVVDTVNRAFLVAFNEVVTIADTLSRSISRALTESFTVTDVIGFFKKGIGFILGLNKSTNTGIGKRGSPPVGKNNDTNTKIGTRKS